MSARIREDEAAVSVVIGAILIAGLLVAGFVGVRVTYVPVWEKDAEREHMEAVVGEFSGIRTVLDGSIGELSGASASRYVPIEPKKQFLASDAPSRHGLDFLPGATGTEFHSVNFLAAQADPDGRDLFSEEWQDIPGRVGDIQQVHNLRLKIDEVGRRDQNSRATYVQVFDARDEWSGSLTVKQVSHAPDIVVRITVQDRNGQTLYDNPNSVHGSETVSPFWVDLLDPQYRFRSVLEQAGKPIVVEVLDHGLDGEFALAYTGSDGLRGAAPPAATGSPSPMKVTAWSGALVYKGPNTRFVAQDLALENGALIMRQSDGAAFRIDPPFAVQDNDEGTTLTIGLPVLNGRATSVGGGDSVGVTLTQEKHRVVWGFTDRFTMNVTSEYPWLWAGYWDFQLGSAGLSKSDGEYRIHVDEEAGIARLTVEGQGEPGQRDLTINLRQTTVRVELRG